jgi:hypothetical protein
MEEQRAEGGCGKGYSRPVMLIKVGVFGSGRCLIDGADEAVVVVVDGCCGCWVDES